MITDISKANGLEIRDFTASQSISRDKIDSIMVIEPRVMCLKPVHLKDNHLIPVKAYGITISGRCLGGAKGKEEEIDSDVERQNELVQNTAVVASGDNNITLNNAQNLAINEQPTIYQTIAFADQQAATPDAATSAERPVQDQFEGRCWSDLRLQGQAKCYLRRPYPQTTHRVKSHRCRTHVFVCERLQ